jgi:1-phosphofructokinase
MKRVLTMTMNPCIDRTIYLTQFRAGETNYVDNIMEEAAGKGINVAVGLAHLYVPVKALGFAYTEDACILYDKLDAEGIEHAFVQLPGRMRVNQKLFDKSTREMTECNERGCPVKTEDVDLLMEVLRRELREASLLVLCGSVPPGVDLNIYGKMTKMAHDAGVPVVLDATGKLLLEGIKENPYLIKPNLDEFVATFLTEKWAETECVDTCVSDQPAANFETDYGTAWDVKKQKVAQTASKLVESGIHYVCISLGKEGIMLVDKYGVHSYAAEPADIKSLQGAGDALVAGICKAIYEKEEKKMAEYALKMAASTISLEGSRMGTL